MRKPRPALACSPFTRAGSCPSVVPSPPLIGSSRGRFAFLLGGVGLLCAAMFLGRLTALCSGPPSEALRAPSHPLVTGDGFRFYADAVCERGGCDISSALRHAAAAKAGGAHPVAFVSADHIGEYLAGVAQWTCPGPDAVPHVVVVHNSDAAFSAKDLAVLERCSCVVALYAQNIARGLWSPRLRAVPIGIENRYNGGLGHTPDVYMLLRRHERLEWRTAWAGAVLQAGATAPPPPFGCGTAEGVVADSMELFVGSFSLGTNRAARCAAAAALLRLPSVARLSVPPRGGSIAEMCRATLGEDIAAQLQSRHAQWRTSARGAAVVAGASASGALRAWLVPPEISGKRDALPSWSSKPATGASLSPLSGLGGSSACDGLERGGDAVSTQRLYAIRGRSSEYNDLRAYLRGLGASPLVVSPKGNGVQCHRTWEALYAGAVPVVARTDSPVDRIYDGLPVVLIDAWDDLAPPAESAVEERAVALAVGALERIGVALRNTARVARLREERSEVEARGACDADALSPESRDAWLCALRIVHHRASDMAARDTYSSASMRGGEQFASSSLAQPEEEGAPRGSAHTGAAAAGGAHWQTVDPLAPCPESSASDMRVATDASHSLADWRGCPRSIETFTFEPALAPLPSAKLSESQRYRLARSVLHLERLTMDFWLGVVAQAAAP